MSERVFDTSGGLTEVLRRALVNERWFPELRQRFGWVPRKDSQKIGGFSYQRCLLAFQGKMAEVNRDNSVRIWSSADEQIVQLAKAAHVHQNERFPNLLGHIEQVLSEGCMKPISISLYSNHPGDMPGWREVLITRTVADLAFRDMDENWRLQFVYILLVRYWQDLRGKLHNLGCGVTDEVQ